MLILYFLLSFVFISTAVEYPKHVRNTLEKIASDVYGVFGVYEQISYKNRGFISNAYFITTEEGVVVVDTLSTYKLGKELIETIRTVTDKPIKFVIVTHYHTDHFYGVSAFKEVGATIIAHEWSYDYISEPSSWNFFKARQKILREHLDGTEMIGPQITFKDELNLNLGKKIFEVKHLCRGHTPGDIIVWLPQKQILFSGDLVFDGRIPFLGSGNSKSWLSCLEKILELKPRLLLPGHGEPVMGEENIRKTVNRTYKYITDLREAIRNMIEEGKDIDYVRENINDALIEKDPSYTQIPVFFDVNPVNAYYVYFEIENELIEEGL